MHSIDRFRDPAYTGENRCLPCTAVNVVIATIAAGGGGTAIARQYGMRPGVISAIGMLSVFLAAIYLRGYLVPGTPRLTRRYLPDRVLSWFGKGSQMAAGGDDGEVDVERVLAHAGAVTDAEHEDDLRLTDGFHDAWRERMTVLRDRDSFGEELAAVLDVDPDRLQFKEFDEIFVAYLDARDQRVGEWESRAAFLADVAAANELRTRYDGWTDLDVEQRGAVLNGLRIFIERCPACDEPVTVEQEVVASCCRSVEVFAGTCDGCAARIFEVEDPG